LGVLTHCDYTMSCLLFKNPFINSQQGGDFHSLAEHRTKVCVWNPNLFNMILYAILSLMVFISGSIIFSKLCVEMRENYGCCGGGNKYNGNLFRNHSSFQFTWSCISSFEFWKGLKYCASQLHCCLCFPVLTLYFLWKLGWKGWMECVKPSDFPPS